MISTNNPLVDKSILFTHLLDYEWKLDLKEAQGFFRRLLRRSPATLSLKPVSTQPRVFQYSPWPGKITPNVTIRHGTDYLAVSGAEDDVKASSNYGFIEGFELTEMITFGLAAVAGVVSGLMTFYLKNATFGSAQDYVTIALWGLSADQTKNAVQSYFGIKS